MAETPKPPKVPEGLLLREAPAQATYGWEVVVITRDKPFAGVGDSAEEALLATLSHVLVRFEQYLGEATDAGRVTERQGRRVRELAAQFHGQIRDLYTTVYPEAQREAAIRRIFSENFGSESAPSTDTTVHLIADPDDDDLLG